MGIDADNAGGLLASGTLIPTVVVVFSGRRGSKGHLGVMLTEPVCSVAVGGIHHDGLFTPNETEMVCRPINR